MNVHRNGTVVLGVALAAVGVAMLVQTARAGGGVGYLLGALFLALGAARVYLALRRRS